LGLEVLAGAAAYVLTLTMLHRDRFFVFWNFIKALRNPLRVDEIVQESSLL
jgi:hypothetical protein